MSYVLAGQLLEVLQDDDYSRGERKPLGDRAMNRVYRLKPGMEGAHRPDIIQLATEEWGLTERQGDEYIAKARKEIKIEVDAMGHTSLEWHIASRLHLFNKAARINDLANARQILDSLAKLQGLWVDKSELLGADGQAIQATRVLVTFVDPNDGPAVVGAGPAISIDPDSIDLDQDDGPCEDDIF